MKRIVFLLFFLAAHVALHAEGPDDQYLQIYSLIQQADTLNQNGQGTVAAQKYLEAQSALTKLQSIYPNWNEKVVKYRLSYVAEKLTPLRPLLSSTNAPSIARARTNKLDAAEVQTQLNSLNAEVRRLQTEKAKLDGKLKEALAVQPAAVDPRRLNKAEEKISTLEKERDLLKVTLDQQKGKPVESKKIKALEKERGELQEKLKEAKREAVAVESRHEKERKSLRAESKTDKKLEHERNELQKELNAARQQLAGAESRAQKNSEAAESKKIKTLRQDRDELQGKLEKAAQKITALESRNADKKSASEKIARLETEREELLKKLKSTQALAADQTRRQEDLKAEFESRRIKELEKERADLQKKLKTAQELAAAQSLRQGEIQSESESKKIQQLENDRADLQKKLLAVNKEMALRETTDRAEIKKLKQAEQDLLKKIKNSGTQASAKRSFRFWPSPNYKKQLAQAKARLETYEAKAAPFTAEELALFKKPVAQPAPKIAVAKKGSKGLPAGTGALAAEAELDFSARRYEEAEKKYNEVLSQDRKNVYALANLASTQMELNHSAEAEKNVEQALEVDPDDAFSLLLLGKLRFSQNKFDEAIDALSRSAKINPKSAEVQNYLGIALSEKGERGPAEAALRKAIQLQPDNASAHHNLAIIYAAQKPPFLELARWHYQKAIGFGHPKNPELEKLLAETK
ncbi:MAG: tetratricopeptide repeat protein [Verrucomicrobiota bacterium]|nr:tetratricopeptide repeat protein [Verrucomicrobiota bacterium]